MPGVACAKSAMLTIEEIETAANAACRGQDGFRHRRTDFRVSGNAATV